MKILILLLILLGCNNSHQDAIEIEIRVVTDGSCNSCFDVYGYVWYSESQIIGHEHYYNVPLDSLPKRVQQMKLKMGRVYIFYDSAVKTINL